MMHSELSAILSRDDLSVGLDEVYFSHIVESSADQVSERELREKVGRANYENYLATIAQHHSIPVMDYEINRFLHNIPKGGVILDIGGCWGWHWRELSKIRPDVGVLIVDFVHSNLVHARRLLGPLVGTQVALMHGDANDLPLPSNSFDGIWTVQTFQHIPNFKRPCAEANRVLKKGGYFINYSLHITPLNKFIYSLLGKNFHTEGVHKNLFFLNRATDGQKKILNDIFGEVLFDRYTECFHHPDLRVTIGGREGSLIGRLDARLGDFPWFGRWVARQRSFEVKKAESSIEL